MYGYVFIRIAQNQHCLVVFFDVVNFVVIFDVQTKPLLLKKGQE